LISISTWKKKKYLKGCLHIYEVSGAYFLFSIYVAALVVKWAEISLWVWKAGGLNTGWVKVEDWKIDTCC